MIFRRKIANTSEYLLSACAQKCENEKLVITNKKIPSQSQKKDKSISINLNGYKNDEKLKKDIKEFKD